MKVGTDAVLLGCLASCGERILDIGTGCGVVALMMAQRCPRATIFALDVDEASVEEAQENALASPFSQRVTIMQGDIQTFQAAPFDCIVCNPPYFTETTLPPDERRSRARNTQSLSFAALCQAAERLMAAHASFSVVIPTKEVDPFVAEAMAVGLHLQTIVHVQTTPKKQPKRSILTFGRQPSTISTQSLTLMNPDGSRSSAYAQLAQDFYL